MEQNSTPDAPAPDESAPPVDAERIADPAKSRDPAKTGKPENRILRHLRSHITPALPEEMAPAIGLELKPLKRLLGKMTREGTVRRSGGGRFTTSRFRRDA